MEEDKIRIDEQSKFNTQTPCFHMDVENCARCGLKHYGLLFERLENPIVDFGAKWTYWAMCPIKQQPILLKVSEVA